MITDKTIARELSDMALDMAAKLDASVARVQEACSEKEPHAYRRAVGVIMDELLVQIMGPIYKIHPAIRPKELK